MAEDYNITEGDCVSSIAFERGLPWETLCNHSNNAQLKQKRKNPNMLKRGDILHVPDLTPNEHARATEKRHKFKLKGAPVRLLLRIMEIPKRTPTKSASEQDESEKHRPGSFGPDPAISQSRRRGASFGPAIHIAN